MSYVVKKKINEENYFYLVHSVKISGKVKKFQIYLGRKKPNSENLEKYSRILKKRADEYMTRKDPLLRIISKPDIKIIEKAKVWYASRLRQSPAAKENYYEWFITTYTYNTNAIEGSSLSKRETAMVLFEGISPPNRPMRDVLAAENHKKAYDWMLKYNGDINKKFILELHEILTTSILNKKESGLLRKVQVYIRGSDDIPPKPENVNQKIKELIRWYNTGKRKYNPVAVASYFHVNFEKIHPFVDFNGRTGRLLLNFILMKYNIPPIDIRNKDRMKYYKAIKSGIHGNINPFVKLSIKYLEEMSKE